MRLRKLDGEQRLLRIRQSLSSEIDAPWHVPPLIGLPEQWITVDADRATKLIDDLASTLTDGSEWINTGPITRVRSITLQFYPHMILCEAETRTFDDADGLITFLHSPEECILLEGSSNAIHKVNATRAVEFSTPEHVLQYAQFFCAAVQGDAGPFWIVPSHANLYYTRELTANERYWLPAHILPPSMPKLSEDREVWQLSASVIHGAHLFHVDFEIRSNGMITMKDDTPKTEDALPVQTWGFWGRVRRDFTVQAARFSQLVEKGRPLKSGRISPTH